jgi:hypothetical protein
MKKTGLIAGLLGFGALALFVSRKAIAGAGGRRYRAPMMLSKNFDLSEFLQSAAMPELKNYSLSTDEMNNAVALVTNILQPLRDKFGPIKITGGFRPPTVVDQLGRSFYDILSAAGAFPSKTSDHILCAAADIAPYDVSLFNPMYQWLKGNKFVRQVILECRVRDGVVKPSWIHVAVATSELPPFSGSLRSFAMLDGKSIAESQVAV